MDIQSKSVTLEQVSKIFKDPQSGKDVHAVDGADFVIAVDIGSKADGIASPASMVGNVNQSIKIMGQKLGAQELARADIVIRPKVNDIGAADFAQRPFEDVPRCSWFHFPDAAELWKNCMSPGSTASQPSASITSTA